MSKAMRDAGHYVIDPELDAFRLVARRADDLAEAAEVARRKDRLADAERLYRSAIDANRSCLRAWPGLGRVLDREGKHDEALAVSRQLVYGDDMAAADRASAPGHRMSLDERRLHGPILTPTGDAAVRMSYVLGLIRLGRWGEALTVFNDTVLENERSQAKHAAAVEKMINQGILGERARSSWSDCRPLNYLARIDPRSGDRAALEAGAHLVVGSSDIGPGSALTDRGAFVAAMQHLARAIQLEPRWGVTFYEYGRLLDWDRRYPEARDAFERALGLSDGLLRNRVQRCFDTVNCRLTPVVAGGQQ